MNTKEIINIETMVVRSASLRNLAVNNKVDAGVLHNAAGLLYDASIELATLRADKKELVEALKGCVPALEDAGLVAGPLVKARRLIAKHSKCG